MKKLILCIATVSTLVASTALAKQPQTSDEDVGSCYSARPVCVGSSPLCVCDTSGRNCNWVCAR